METTRLFQSNEAAAVNNLQEFTDPAQYDAENLWAADDQFYLELAKRVGSPILDVACGTGRLTRAIAKEGLEVTGLDIMAPMLAQGRRLSSHLAVNWIQADCRVMGLARRYRLMLMTSHAFQCLLTDQDQNDFLEEAYLHLDDGGILAFETRNPSIRQYNSHGSKHSLQNPAGRIIEVSVRSTFNPGTMIDNVRIARTGQKTGETFHSRIALRYISADDLNHRLERKGFKILAQYGDWSKSPVNPSSPEIITIASKAPS